MGAAVDNKARARGELTPRQQRFVDEYMQDLNATQAAIRAGYSRNGAEVAAARTLRIAKVQHAISEAQRARRERTEISADRVLRELAAVALSDVGEVLEQKGKTLALRSLSTMPEYARRAIESIREQPTERGVVRSVKLHNKVAALKLLFDHYGLEQPKKVEHEVAGVEGKPIAVRQAHSLSRDLALEISAKILGVSKRAVADKFTGPPEDESAENPPEATDG